MKKDNVKKGKKLVMLKWPGGKSKLSEKILSLNNGKKTLIEPFMGSGSVFLNIGDNFDRYIGNDNNSDLILLFNEVKKDPFKVIKITKEMFLSGNSRSYYDEKRTLFNSLDREDPFRAAIFLYLNRHGFNGLCRYSMKKGNYNVPFGNYVKPYFPEKEILEFNRIANSIECEFVCSDFSSVFSDAHDSLIYSDPPFLELSSTSSFKNYSGSKFTESHDKKLNSLSFESKIRGNISVVSNHFTPSVLDIYDKYTSYEIFESKRNISCKERKPVKEVIMIYS